MKLKTFAIKDLKIEAFKNPLFLHTQGEAIRALTDELKNPQSLFASHPADFILYELGTYETDTAKFDLHEQPQLVICCDELIDKN